MSATNPQLTHLVQYQFCNSYQSYIGTCTGEYYKIRESSLPKSLFQSISTILVSYDTRILLPKSEGSWIMLYIDLTDLKTKASSGIHYLPISEEKM